MSRVTSAAALSLCAALALASRPAGAAPNPIFDATPRQLRLGGDDQLRFLAFFLSRAEMSNIAPENDLLQGQTIGRLFGPNSTKSWDKLSVYAEQRLIPFVIFEPRILNQKARLRAAFDLKWTWGDLNYGVGGNFGGAINAHQVNIQTTNLEVEINLPWPTWYVNVGLQRLYDNPRDLYRTLFGPLSLTGERLAFWGADAVGVSVIGTGLGNMYKFGVYDLYENTIGNDDNVILTEALIDRWLGRTLHVGGSVRWLRDTSSGAGGISVLSQGPGSKLADYNGAFRFPLGGQAYSADVVWVGLDASYNPELAAGRFGASAFVVGNFGAVRTGADKASLNDTITIAGLTASARAGYRYGVTRNDAIVGEVLFTSGDTDGIADKQYNGVITGNTWGSPGAAFTSHGAYLLLPHLTVVNRFYAAVSDISNMGFGLTAGTLNASYDLIRNNLTLKVGGAVGYSNVAPMNGGHFIGVEANGSVVWRLGVFLSLELHAAYLKLGDFYDSAVVVKDGVRPRDPWTSFVALRWLMF